MLELLAITFVAFLIWLFKRVRKISVMGQAMIMSATVNPEDWKYEVGYACFYHHKKFGKVYEDIDPFTTASPYRLTIYERAVVIRLLRRYRWCRDREKLHKKSYELMDYALAEARKKLPERTSTHAEL